MQLTYRIVWLMIVASSYIIVTFLCFHASWLVQSLSRAIMISFIRKMIMLTSNIQIEKYWSSFQKPYYWVQEKSILDLILILVGIIVQNGSNLICFRKIFYKQLLEWQIDLDILLASNIPKLAWMRLESHTIQKHKILINIWLVTIHMNWKRMLSKRLLNGILMFRFGWNIVSLIDSRNYLVSLQVIIWHT